MFQDELRDGRGARRGLDMIRIARKVLVAHASTGIDLAKLCRTSCGLLKSPR
jgi:hypothetical protein